MKNNIYSQKYSILIIILLILIFVYIHIENPNQIMKGGIDYSDIIKKSMNEDKIYMFTVGHPIIRWVILVIIIGLLISGLYFGTTVFFWTGAPAINIGGAENTYQLVGTGFLAKFYDLTQDILIFKSDPKYSLVTKQEERDQYLDGIYDFKQNAKDKIEVFCNAVLPCNKCECPGYTGSNTDGMRCGPDPTNKQEGGEYAAKILEENSKNAEKFLGFAPKCCCLDRFKAGPKPKYIEDKSIVVDYSNTRYWKVEETPNSSNPEIKTKKYIFKAGSVALKEIPPEIKAEDVIPGCVQTYKRSDGTSPPPSYEGCVCLDGDPTLNYIGHINDPPLTADQKLIALKQKVFAKWGSKELLYRVKKINADNTIPTFLPDFYYTDDKKTKIKDKDIKNNPSSDSDGNLYNFRYDPETKNNPSIGSRIIIFDVEKYKSDDFTGDAAFMNGKNHYYYSMPESTIGKEVDTNANPILKQKVEQAKEHKLPNASPINSPGISRFFGGIYENIQTYVGLNK